MLHLRLDHNIFMQESDILFRLGGFPGWFEYFLDEHFFIQLSERDIVSIFSHIN